MKNEVILSFCIWDFNDITHKEINYLLGIDPYKIYVKGQKKNSGNYNSIELIKENGWIMRPPLDQFSSFEDQMNSLMGIIESKMNNFRIICEKYYCEFSCAVFIRFDNGESTPSVHLTARYNQLIKQLNIEFDLDLYCLPNSAV